MNRFYRGVGDGFGVKVGIIAARFNEPCTYALLADVQKELIAQKVQKDDITIGFVPGALEIPQASLKIMRNHELDAIIALGCVIKGETAHFEYVSKESMRGIMDITLGLEMPIINGILTCYTVDQALDRVYRKEHKGTAFARAAIEMVNLYRMM
ncbi:6,7-dimethyl-8-ribityllumazine synthase [Patescibacteria group bacterium]|nr:6,7-dimethyl-8-ribityllumazine synthase [Patescibacteria group bacterium]